MAKHCRISPPGRVWLTLHLSIIDPDFQALVDINELMRTEKNTVRKRLLADPEPGEVTAGASENGGGGGGPSVTYVTATGEIIDQRIVGEMHAAAAAAGDGQSEAKKIIIPAGAATTTGT